MPKKKRIAKASPAAAPAKETEFVIDEGGLMTNSKLPSLVQRAIAFFDSYGFGKLLTARGAAAALDCAHITFAHCASHPALADYRQLHRGNTDALTRQKGLFGSKPTIAALRKKLGK